MTDSTRKKKYLTSVDRVKSGGLSRCVLRGTLQSRGRASRIGGKKKFAREKKKKKRSAKGAIIYTIAVVNLPMVNFFEEKIPIKRGGKKERGQKQVSGGCLC
jgi:hypothetical protein